MAVAGSEQQVSESIAVVPSEPRTGSVGGPAGAGAVGETAAADGGSAATSAAAGRARTLLWVAFGFFVAGVGIGTGWDRRWHATHPFEDFFSPPHLFIYSCVLLTIGTVAVLAFSLALRRRFGPDIAVP